MKKLVSAFSIFVFLNLAGCATLPQPTDFLLKPAPMVVRPVVFSVYTKKNIAKLQTDLDTNGGVIIALTSRGYKNLSFNLLEAQRFIREQKAINVYLAREVNRVH